MGVINKNGKPRFKDDILRIMIFRILQQKTKGFIQKETVSVTVSSNVVSSIIEEDHFRLNSR